MRLSIDTDYRDRGEGVAYPKGHVIGRSWRLNQGIRKEEGEGGLTVIQFDCEDTRCAENETRRMKGVTVSTRDATA